MTNLRFDFQRECASEFDGWVLNVGANDDPANLAALGNVINCDIRDYPGVDKHFDCTEDRWPFDDDFADLVIFGDIVEHMYPEEFRRALKEAHRVARNLCITLPKDERIFDPGYFEAIEGQPKGHVHVFAYTPEHLEQILQEEGWEINTLRVVDYVFVPEGYFIEASRYAA